MSLNVEYVFKVLDRFSGPLDRMAGKVNKFNDRINESTKNLKQLGAGITKVGAVMSAAITLPIALMGKAAIQAASDAEETRSKYATVFKDIGDMAENTADSFAKNFGLAGSTARQLLGDTGDMLSGFGFTSEAALKLSKRTNELAVDLASFTNFSGGAKGASEALTKALLGERESVKSLGIAILEEDVKKKVALMRSQGMRFASMREAKAYATLEIAISQSKNAIGDYARTKKSFANVQRRVFENNKMLAESFGKILIPYATKALNVIDKFQQRLADLNDNEKKWLIIISAVVAALGPLLVILGLFVKSIGLMIVGFWALISVVSAFVIAFHGIKIGLIISKWVFGIENLRGAWNSLVRDTRSSVDVFDGISKLGERFHVGVTSLVLGEEAGMRAASRIAANNSANAARKSEQRIGLFGTVNGQMTINNNGQKTQTPLTGSLGGQMAGAL